MTNRSGNRSPRAPQPPEEDDYAPAPRRRSSGNQRMGLGEAVAKSFIRSIASSLGRIIVRSITGRLR